MAGSMSDVIWVICPDYGYEGLRAPIQAFADEAAAQRAIGLLSQSYQSFRLCAVPLWSEDKPRPST